MTISLAHRDTGRRASASLKRLWQQTALCLVVLVGATGMLGLGAGAYQRTIFVGTISDLHDEFAALMDLELALGGFDTPAGALMYGLDGPEAQAGHLAEFQRVRAAVDEAFDAVDEVSDQRGQKGTSDRGRDVWEGIEAAVVAAPALVESGAVAEALSGNEDPFRPTVWEPLRELESELRGMRQAALLRLDAQVAAVADVQQGMAMAMTASLFIALALTWVAARRMRTAVVSPLLRLGHATHTLASADNAPPLELTGAARELQELAASFNRSADSLRSSRARLRAQASTDALTGLLNRAAFMEATQARLDDPGTRTAVLFIDLDDFKLVNDTRGHAAGDQVLQAMAARLRDNIRDRDIAARLGGDEFAVVVDCTLDEDIAATIAGRIVDALSQPATADGVQETLACSVGVSLPSDRTSTSPDELLRQADLAMYAAKAQGKNQMAVYATSMHVEGLAASGIRRDLAEAIRRGQFVLHYQPVVDLGSGDLVGFEALIRWDHPTLGRVPPGAFISLAEETGHITAIGAWTIDEACRELARQHRIHPGLPPLQMSVNVSSVQIEDALVDTVTEALARHDLAPDWLIVELTETVAIADHAKVFRVLTRLRAAGVRIALDDFGAGYSSLRWLQELPVDIIKIDRSFVAKEGHSHGVAVLEAIVGMARRMGLGIVAEGIERPSERARLLPFGPMAGQGYLFAPPLPADEAAGVPRRGPVIAEAALRPVPMAY